MYLGGKRKDWKQIKGGKTDRPFVVQRTIWYFEQPKECPDFCIPPIKDWVYAHKRWPVRISLHTEFQCCCTSTSKYNGWLKTNVEYAPPCGSVLRMPMRMASTVGQCTRYSSKASRMLIPSVDASPSASAEVAAVEGGEQVKTGNL